MYIALLATPSMGTLTFFQVIELSEFCRDHPAGTPSEVTVVNNSNIGRAVVCEVLNDNAFRLLFEFSSALPFTWRISKLIWLDEPATRLMGLNETLPSTRLDRLSGTSLVSMEVPFNL